ncbi:hypothetical protein WJ01_07520 [Burkholderia vietnamiensis]|nr:hypothetical protein WJ01_07520 [Burkholderia vietnamiensis]
MINPFTDIFIMRSMEDKVVTFSLDRDHSSSVDNLAKFTLVELKLLIFDFYVEAISFCCVDFYHRSRLFEIGF